MLIDVELPMRVKAAAVQFLQASQVDYSGMDSEELLMVACAESARLSYRLSKMVGVSTSDWASAMSRIIAAEDQKFIDKFQ